MELFFFHFGHLIIQLTYILLGRISQSRARTMMHAAPAAARAMPKAKKSFILRPSRA